MGTGVTVLLILGVLVYLTGVATNFWAVGAAVGSPQNLKQIKDAVITTAVVNVVLTIVLGFLSTAYIASNPTAERPYVLFMLHATFLLSLIAVSISSIQKIDPTILSTTGAAAPGSGCSA